MNVSVFSIQFMRLPFLAATLFLGLSSGSFSQVPAQIPLLNRVGGGVVPNFMLTLDDSGSMLFQHMPETTFDGGTFATPIPSAIGGGVIQLRWDPRDTFGVLNIGGVATPGNVPGNITSTNYLLRASRSADTNTMFYNPEIRYQPWLKADGTRFPNSPPAAAYMDPPGITGASGTVINLTSYTAPGGSSTWCFSESVHPVPTSNNPNAFVAGVTYTITTSGTTNWTLVGSPSSSTGTVFTAIGVGSGTGRATPSAYCSTKANNMASLNHDPGVYFKLQKQTVNANSLVVGTTYTVKTLGTTNFTLVGAPANTVGTKFTANGVGVGTGTVDGYKSVTNYANYTAISINAPLVLTYEKVAARGDCTGAIGLAGCSKAEERQNFANWFTYYRNRNLLARGAMMESFGAVAAPAAAASAPFRVGFGRINKGSGTVDGISTTVIESNTATYGGGGVRAYTQARKNQLFKWLEDLPAGGGTPLPAAMEAVGAYYSRTDNRGPYTDDPSIANTVADNKTCRRSYQLMVTDGYWNGTNNVADEDSTAGTTIGSFTFQANTRPYADGVGKTLADVAMKYWKNDLQPGMANQVKATGDDPSFWQNMTNFTVGLGVRGALDPLSDLPALQAGTKTWGVPSETLAIPANIDDLWHAALNSRGAYYSAKDPSSLASAVASALTGAQGGGGATAGVATASTTLEAGNRKYVPNYDGITWSGNIEALTLDTAGQATTTDWTATSRLPIREPVPPEPADPTRFLQRNIYTWDAAPLANPTTPSAVLFDWTNLSLLNRAAMGTSSVVPALYTTDFTHFIRGDHRKEGAGQPFRSRLNAAGQPFILGDIVNSNPVLIKGIFNGAYDALGLGGSSAYQDFIAFKRARESVLFVGGNDGMLHAFKDVNAQPPATSTAATDGAEIFAYVPRAVYANLYKLAEKNYGGIVPHQYYVDGPQNEGDAYVKGPGATPGTLAATPSWRNYLLGSLGAGGRAIYALDVTSSPTLNASNVRWEISSATDSDMGYILSPIEVGVLQNGQWVAIFGNGFSSGSGKATLFVVDLETAAIKKLDVDTTGSNGLGGVGILRNASGQIASLYAGDLKGKLWKFDYTAGSPVFTTSGGVSPFTVSGSSPFFTATTSGGAAQAITQPPSIFNHTQGGKIIVFGTGKLFAAGDETDFTAQTVYGVWDKPADTLLRPLARAQLQPRTFAAQAGVGLASGTTFYSLTGSAVNWATQRGWAVDLSTILTGGRVIYPTQVFSPTLVLVTAVAPAQSVAVCSASNGVGADLVFEVETGLPTTYPLFDTNGNGQISSDPNIDPIAAGILTNAVGRRAVVTGITSTVCTPPKILKSIQTATGQTYTCVDPGNTRTFDRVWRRIINPPIR